MATIAETLALALSYHQAGNLSQAKLLYQQILRVNPAHADALHLLGAALSSEGQHDLAIAYIQQALTVKPRTAVFHNNLGFAYQALGRLDEAAFHYQQAVALQPGYAEAHNNLGNVLRAQGKQTEAVESYRQALRLQPTHALAHNNLGVALQELGRLDEAVVCHREALRLYPEFVDAHNNLANALKEQGRLDEALAQMEQALRLDPGDAAARWNRSLLWLLRGDFERGWPEYEWRWTQPAYVPRRFPQPRWDGTPLAGRTVLVHAEQGLGDTLQFVRYAPLLRARGGRILVQCSTMLLPLLASCAGIDQVLPESEPLPPFDVHVPLLSLPGLMGTTLGSIPANVPYLSADASLVDHWKQELAAVGPGFRIGIVWQGNPRHPMDRRRSIPLEQFAPLAAREGVRLFSLQVGAGAEHLTALGERFAVIDLGGRFDKASLADAAAAIMALDLVVTVDTAVAHLAGALGRPVWVALPYVPDWRWLLDRENSPWYPTMRLFRQRELGNWTEVFERITAALEP